MKTPDIYPLMDDCRVLGEQLKGLMAAIKIAGSELDGHSHASCMSLCITLEERRDDLEAKLFKAFHQLNIVNDAVNSSQ